MPALRKYQIGATVCMVSSNRKVLFALKRIRVKWDFRWYWSPTLSLSIMLHILRAGPSLSPRYFMSMVVLSNNRALPSISWVRNASTCMERVGSNAEIWNFKCARCEMLGIFRCWKTHLCNCLLHSPVVRILSIEVGRVRHHVRGPRHLRLG